MRNHHYYEDGIDADQEKKKNKNYLLWVSVAENLVFITSAGIALAVVSNGLNSLAQSLLGTPGSFWQHQYDKISQFFDHDDFKIFFYGTMVVQYVNFWSVAVCFLIMDLTLKPEFLRKYKIQPGTNEPVETKKLLKAVAVVHFNQTVLNGGGLVVCWWVMLWGGYDSSRLLPTVNTVLLQLVFFIFLHEVLFYYGHRSLHHRLLYKHVHKVHHEWQSPISINALYSHPVEHVFVVFAPVMMGPLLVGSHPATTWLWLQLAQLSILNSHCGYHLPFLPSPEAHDYHHLKFTECYGSLGIMDTLHGTDQRFRRTHYWTRHFTSLSRVPVRDQVPHPQ